MSESSRPIRAAYPSFFPMASTSPVQVVERAPKLLDALRAQLRVMHYAIRTEEAYVDWVRRFILFHEKRHPKDMGPNEVAKFLSDLAGPLVVSCGNQRRQSVVVVAPHGHVGKSQSCLSTCPCGLVVHELEAVS